MYLQPIFDRPFDRPVARDFHDAVLRGLRENPARIPCKYLYDQRGSELFNAICEIPEYYPTRVELALMERHGQEMGRLIGPEARIVEFGSGSGLKTQLLLGGLDDPVGYVPIDISLEELEQCMLLTLRNFPDLDVQPLYADYTSAFRLPIFESVPRRDVFYYPGSTIGNFTPAEAEAFLAGLRSLTQGSSTQGGLLIGVDLKKDPALIERAYNDRRGITAEFNRNMLHRINRELGGDFNPRAFAHAAPYLVEEGCVEMRLVSARNQEVLIDDLRFSFAEGDYIATERSYKYTIVEFTALAKSAGWRCQSLWTDEENSFAIWYLHS